MGDLLDLLRREAADRHEVIEAWLRGRIIDDEDAEFTRVLQDMSRQVLLAGNGASDPIISIRIPEEEHGGKHLERFLQPLGATISNNEAHVSGLNYVRHVRESTGLPLMQVDYDAKVVKLALNGAIHILTRPLPDPATVDRSLEHIESYFRTVDFAETTDPFFAKTAMCEALLYFLWSPFATAYMTTKRNRYGSIESRGPRFLYLFGPAQNGKTTFLRFALKLLTGHLVEPLTGADFLKTRIRYASSFGTAFPLAFDDLTPTKNAKTFEEILKNYWENWWRPGQVYPQIAISSNTESLPEWAKSRVKHIDFDVHFAPNDRDKQRLNEIFSTPNELFSWFSSLYLEERAASETFSEDELYLARRCVQRLYEHSGRPLPSFFPGEPIEKLFDPGRKRWREILSLKKAKVRSEGRRTVVEFKPEMEQREVKQYQGHLPQTVKSTVKGKTIVIDSPKVFGSWLRGNQRRPSLTGRILGSILTKRG